MPVSHLSHWTLNIEVLVTVSCELWCITHILQEMALGSCYGKYLHKVQERFLWFCERFVCSSS